MKLNEFLDCIRLLDLPLSTRSHCLVYYFALIEYGNHHKLPVTLDILAAASVHIACKQTYIQRKLRDVVNVFYYAIHTSDRYIELNKQASQWISIVNILEGFSTMIFVGSILYAICHPTRMKMSIVSQDIFYHVLGNMIAAFIEVVAGCSELVSDNVISRLTFHIPVFVRIYQFYIYTLLTKELNLLTTVDTMKIAKVHDMYDINKSAGVDDLSSHAIAVEQRRLNLSVQVKFAKIPEQELGNWQTSFKSLHGGH
ncbi:hypothetical protein HDV02_001308 [Globomyces sp. JEL0801]|nr:hypothetical protein HDV02_001308 [Globomyces sp. JEL0801]